MRAVTQNPSHGSSAGPPGASARPQKGRSKAVRAAAGAAARSMSPQRKGSPPSGRQSFTFTPRAAECHATTEMLSAPMFQVVQTSAREATRRFAHAAP